MKYNVDVRKDLFSVSLSVEVGLGTELAQLRVSVGTHIDLRLLRSCTFASLVTVLLCALDHSSNALPLAQDAGQNRLPFDSSSANSPRQGCLSTKSFFCRE